MLCWLYLHKKVKTWSRKILLGYGPIYFTKFEFVWRKRILNRQMIHFSFVCTGCRPHSRCHRPRSSPSGAGHRAGLRSTYPGQRHLKDNILLLVFFKKKMGQPRPLFRLFSVFSNKHYKFYNKYMWKNVHPCRDSNPRPSERESLPITTRPGLPPHYYCLHCFVAYRS